MTRGALLIALLAIFALLFSAFAQLYYLPAPAMLVLGVIFLLLGLMLIVLTVRQGSQGREELADEAKTIVPDAWMQIRIAPLYRTRKDGYEAFEGIKKRVRMAHAVGIRTSEPSATSSISSR
ncbi:MAG: hypothetical protein WBN60_15515 [Polyangiales bacterium]